MEARMRELGLLPPPQRPLNNLTCPYCGTDLGETAAQKEHVVGLKQGAT